PAELVDDVVAAGEDCRVAGPGAQVTGAGGVGEVIHEDAEAGIAAGGAVYDARAAIDVVHVLAQVATPPSGRILDVVVHERGRARAAGGVGPLVTIREESIDADAARDFQRS